MDVKFENESDLNLPIPKDGHYGWVIVFGAFLINMIIDGICLSFGIFYKELVAYYGQGQSKTAWAGSVLSGTYSLLGKSVILKVILGDEPLH